MAASWPITLQGILNEDNFGLDFADTVLRSDNEIGPTKLRRRFTKGVDTYQGSINLTVAQFNIFETFYKTTLAGGSLPFTYNHPITGVPTDYRFRGRVKFSSLGGGNFSVQFELEQLP